MTDQQQEQPAYATAAAVAGLAREVEALRHAVNQLEQVPGRVDQLTQLVTQLAETAAAARAPAGPAPSWLDLPARVREAHRLLAELVDWMLAVYLRYADAAATLPECWLWHPDVIEELVWLRHAWLAAYREQDAPGSAAGDWHDRYRPGVVRRISSAHGRCSLENHQPRPGRPMPAGPVVPLGSAIDLIAGWWGSERQAAAPEPAAEHLASVATRQRAGGPR